MSIYLEYGGGAPYMSGDINKYDSIVDPSTVHVDRSGISFYYKRYLLEKIMSVFEFKNIPETWNKSFFLYNLLIRGTVAVFDTDKFGNLCLNCSLSGYNVYYQPTDVIIANPLLPDFKTLKIGKDCEIIKMQPDYGGVYDIVTYYANLLSLCSQSISVNLINSRLSYVFGCDNNTSAQSFKKMFDKIVKGEPAIFIDKNLLGEDGKPNWSFFSQNLKENYIASTVLQDMVAIDNRFDAEIGLTNVNIAKPSGVSGAEVAANDESTKSKCRIWLESIQEGLEKVNEMFGLSISVELREGAQYAENVDNAKRDI